MLAPPCRSWFKATPHRLLVALTCLGLPPALASASHLFWNPAALAQTRTALVAHDPETTEALQVLRAAADEARAAGPWSVTNKPFTPPSGDKRDYMSVGPYWWPDPDQPDGLPYIRRDGEVNPERALYDNVTLGRMSTAVRRLGLAYHFTEHEPYAEHAARLLRVWFLDETTRMNPHLQYGQAIPGITEGRFIGIIDTASLVAMLDAVLLLRASPAWTEADHAGLQGWFDAYLRWLLASAHGVREGNYHNNHGTWHDLQCVTYALFVGDLDLATALLEHVPRRRIVPHLAPDGRQPRELARTLPLHYSIYNARALVKLAVLGRHVDVDLWAFADDEGRSLARALDWLRPYFTGEAEYERPDIRPLSWATVRRVYRVAANATGRTDWETALAAMPAVPLATWAETHLIHPPHAPDNVN